MRVSRQDFFYCVYIFHPIFPLLSSSVDEGRCFSSAVPIVSHEGDDAGRRSRQLQEGMLEELRRCGSLRRLPDQHQVQEGAQHGGNLRDRTHSRDSSRLKLATVRIKTRYSWICHGLCANCVKKKNYCFTFYFLFDEWIGILGRDIGKRVRASRRNICGKANYCSKFGFTLT